MLALGMSAFMGLSVGGFGWFGRGLITDSKGILSDYGVDLDSVDDKREPYTPGPLSRLSRTYDGSTARAMRRSCVLPAASSAGTET